MLKQSFIYSIWLYARTAIMAVTTIYLAKESSSLEYGTYVSAIAVAGFFVPFMHGGMAYIYLDSERLLGQSNEDAERHWRKILLVSGPIVGIIVYSTICLIIDSPILTLTELLLIAVTEISLIGLCEIQSRKGQLKDNPMKMGFWQTAPHLIRLTLFVIATQLLHNEKSIQTWIYSSFLACSICLIPIFSVSNRNPEKKLNKFSSFYFFIKSLHFGIGGASLRTTYEIDKPIISSIMDPSYTATLSISQRLIDVAAIPANSISSIALAKMLNSNSTDDKNRYFRLALMQGIIASSGASLIIFFASPIIISYIGSGYSESLNYLPYLSWCPFVILIKGLLGSWIATQGDSNLYAKYNFLGLIVRLFTCIPLISIHGIIGAIYSLLISEIFVIAMMSIRKLRED